MQDIHWPMGLIGYFPSYTQHHVRGAVRRDHPGSNPRVGPKNCCRGPLASHQLAGSQHLERGQSLGDFRN
ncbi:MAG: hypothetical protein IPO43_04615 [Rhodoferax sp.]|nr:hypothetical protein [Rhodoferax sp.]